MRENEAMAEHGAAPDQAGQAGQAGERAGGGAADEQRPRARDLNQLIRYTMWSVFRIEDRAAIDLVSRETLAAEVADLFEQASGKDMVPMGCYDLQGVRP